MSAEGEATPRDSQGRGRLASVLRGSSRRRRAAVAVALGLVVAVGAWLLLRGAVSEGPRRVGATLLSQDGIRAFAARNPRPIYWAGVLPPGGPATRPTYELSRTRDGEVYVRYMPPGARAGDRRPAFLTVGTYPSADARAVIETGLRRAGATRLRVPGGLGVVHRDRPQSVYVLYTGRPELVEVYDPQPERARRLVTEGRVRPIRRRAPG